jgi:hypothetical protein
LAGDLEGVGAEIDGDVEAVFHQAEIFIAGPIQGLNAGGDVERFFYQAIFNQSGADLRQERLVAISTGLGMG